MPSPAPKPAEATPPAHPDHDARGQWDPVLDVLCLLVEILTKLSDGDASLRGDKEGRGTMEPPPASLSHPCLAAVVIACSMGAMDVYLVEQSAGARRLGVCTLALAGDLLFLLVLRYAASWARGEARPAQRGYAVTLWLLFAFALEVKLFFVYQHYATEARAPDPLARRTLALLLSVCVPALYTLLGAAELVAQAAASFRKKDELRGCLFWVVLDLLDVLEIQASLWEPQRRGGLPLWAEGLAFFYCYGLLLVLPCVSLSELGLQGPRGGALYPLVSLASVNVATVVIRGGLLLLCHDQRVSSIFMGKNLLAIALKGCAAFQRHRGGRGAGEADPGRPPSSPPTPHGESAPNRPRGGAQTTSSQPCRSPAADQPRPSQGLDVKSHRTAPAEGHQLHRHCHAKDPGPCSYGHSPRCSPRAPAAAGPPASRDPKAGCHVQLKSVWGGP
ncbi:hypothetical protein lerEdw1_007279 [Lerista edwardsae]|nr:hypothetical protein lerEdw1_007279 [Lerista edwardsae]